MPIYEYQCIKCHHQLEAFQKVTDEPLVACPACHHEALTKLISASSFQLKGTGWYATDFRNKNNDKAANANVSEGGEKTSSLGKTSSSDSSSNNAGAAS